MLHIFPVELASAYLPEGTTALNNVCLQALHYFKLRLAYYTDPKNPITRQNFDVAVHTLSTVVALEKTNYLS